MLKSTNDRALTSLLMNIVLLSLTLLGFSQTTHTKTVECVLLEKCPTRRGHNEDIRRLKRDVLEKLRTNSLFWRRVASCSWHIDLVITERDKVIKL